MELWSPHTAARFGDIIGGVWLFAIAFFILFGIIWTFKISWVVFLFATAATPLIQGLMMGKKEK
jgi:hypothetical protein